MTIQSEATTMASAAAKNSSYTSEDIVVLDVSRPLAITDFFVIATIRSTRQSQALAREFPESAMSPTLLMLDATSVPRPVISPVVPF